MGLLMLTGGPSGAGPHKPAPPPAVRALEPAEVLRGMPVKVTGTDFHQATEIRVRLNEKELDEKPRSEDGKSFTFRIPHDFPLGRYTMRAVFVQKDNSLLVQGVPVPAQQNQLRVVSDTPETVKVTGIYPLV